jgi:hypothetical protein
VEIHRPQMLFDTLILTALSDQLSQRFTLEMILIVDRSDK